MPLYEYRCEKCTNMFEKIVSITSKEAVCCPCCGSGEVEKLFSSFATSSTGKNCSAPAGSGFS